MKHHANTHGSRLKASASDESLRSTPVAQAAGAEAASRLAHGSSNQRVDHSPRQIAQRRALGTAFGPLAQQEVDPQDVLQQKALNPGKLNVAGENHGESGPRRDYEMGYAAKNGVNSYWKEGEFTYSITSFFNAFVSFVTREPRSVEMHGDPYLLRAENLLTMLCHNQRVYKTDYSLGGKSKAAADEFAKHLRVDTGEIMVALTRAGESTGEKDDFESKGLKAAVLMEDIANRTRRFTGTDDASANDLWVTQIMQDIVACTDLFQKSLSKVGKTHEEVSGERSKAMLKAAEASKKLGLWKVGNDHITDINAAGGPKTDEVQIMTRQEFNDDYLLWAVAECDGLAKKIAVSATIAEGGQWVDQVKAILATFGPEQIKAVRIGLITAIDAWYMKSQGRRPSQDAMLDEQGLKVLK